VSVNGRYVYVVDSDSDDLKVIKVSDPSTPTLVGSLGAGTSPFSVYVSGRYAYVTDVGSNDLKMIDVSDPSTPALAGSLGIGSIPRSVIVSGRYAYVVDGGTADLKVIDVSGAEVTSMMAHSLEAGNLQVRNDIIVQGQLQITGGLNIGNGGIYSDGDVGIAGNLGIVDGDLTVNRGPKTSNLTRSLTIGGARNMSGSDFARIDFENLDDDNLNTQYIGARISSRNDGAADDGDLRFFTNGGTLVKRMTIESGGNVGIGNFNNPSHPLEMASGAHVTAGGVWTDMSSRDYKENIQDLTSAQALTTLLELKPKQFNYIVDPEETYLGFVAEDVPYLVATNERIGLSPMDFVAVLTKVVQDQQKMIKRLEMKIDSLARRLSKN